MAKLFRVIPGYVYSRSDGQDHYVTAHRLMRLYGVDPSICVVHDSSRAVPDDDLIKLAPRYSGNYSVVDAIQENREGRTMSNISFQEFKDSGHRQKGSGRYLRPDGGWCIFVGFERRGFPVFVQRAKDDKQIMVKAGCRFYTLRQSMNHWGRRSRRPNGKIVLQLIELGLKTALYEQFIKQRFYPRFFSTKLTRP